jgi:hypothetical protein
MSMRWAFIAAIRVRINYKECFNMKTRLKLVAFLRVRGMRVGILVIKCCHWLPFTHKIEMYISSVQFVQACSNLDECNSDANSRLSTLIASQSPESEAGDLSDFELSSHGSTREKNSPPFSSQLTDYKRLPKYCVQARHIEFSLYNMHFTSDLEYMSWVIDCDTFCVI